MGFQEPRSDVSICNKALSRVFQQPITSLSDPANKLASRECNRWYKTVVRTLLEKHHFGIATKRVALVAGIGSREEWAYAYVQPSDLAFPVSVQPWGSNGTTQINYYRGIGYLIGQLYGRAIFRQEGGVLYSSMPDATLDYVSFDITEHNFTQTFENLVVAFLSAELANPLAKDRQLANDLRTEATNMLNQAIANSLNATQPRYGDGPSEAELARAGGDPRLYGAGGYWNMR